MIRTSLLLPVLATLLGFASVGAQAQTTCPPGQVIGPVIGYCHTPFLQQPPAPRPAPPQGPPGAQPGAGGPHYLQQQQHQQQMQQQGGGPGPCPQGQTRGPFGHCHLTR
jgi:hypothetical protein